MVFVPGELFAELGLELKRRSPFRHTFVVESLSESIGYIPNRIAYNDGGYQSGVGTRVPPGGGELLLERSVDLLLKATD
jgi:neutral ceramidase